MLLTASITARTESCHIMKEAQFSFYPGYSSDYVIVATWIHLVKYLTGEFVLHVS